MGCFGESCQVKGQRSQLSVHNQCGKVTGWGSRSKVRSRNGGHEIFNVRTFKLEICLKMLSIVNSWIVKNFFTSHIHFFNKKFAKRRFYDAKLLVINTKGHFETSVIMICPSTHILIWHIKCFKCLHAFLLPGEIC